MNIINLNKQFYYQFHNRIYQSDPIYEFVPSTRPISASLKGSETWKMTWNLNLRL